MSDIGEIANQYWLEISNHFPDVILDDFRESYDRTKMLLSKVIHGFKSSVTRIVREKHKGPKFLWQRSFYDHIVCSEKTMEKIREYIRQNSLNWQLDIENKKIYSKMGNRDLKKYYEKIYS